MNILYVCADAGIPLLGAKGASVHVRQITAALHRAGHHVTVAVRRLGDGAPRPVVGEVVQLDADHTELEQLVDLADLVIERYSLATGPARQAAARRTVPYVLEVNAPLVAEAARYRGLTDIDAWSLWQAQTWATADLVVTVSRPLQRLVAQQAPRVQVELLRNGVAPIADGQAGSGRSREQARLELGLGLEDVAVAFVGSMKPWHGVLELMEAFPGLAGRAHLLLAGHGPLDEEVRRRAEQLGPRVHVLGAVPHAEVHRLLSAADVGVAPYLTVDDFYFSPLKVLEYLQAGLPVVYSDEGDIAEIVGPAGIGVPAGDVAGLTSALQSLIEQPARRGELAATARSQVLGATWDDVAQRLLDLAMDCPAMQVSR